MNCRSLIKKNYKDECDNCHKMRICKGFNKLVLCEECTEKEKIKLNKITYKVIYEKDNQIKFDL